MRITLALPLVVATVIGPLVVADASAQVTRIEFQVVESPAFGGESFGSTGQYERLRGVAYGEVDPNDVRHRGIVNLDKAPLNARGRVEYSTTVEIYRPVDLERWNKAIYHIVPNRGRASVASLIECRIEPSELNPCVGCGELPIDACVLVVSEGLPRFDLASDHVDVVDSPVQTLRAEHVQLDFGHIQPASVLRG